MRTPLIFRTCTSALQSPSNPFGNNNFLPAIRRRCACRFNDAAVTSRRNSRCIQVAGLSNIPTSNTYVPPLGVSAFVSQSDDGFVAPPPADWATHHHLMAGCEPGKQLNVAVLLSGGVDSSLALRLLRAAGHTCRAFYLQIWFQEDFRNFWDACPWEEDLQYARQVCDSLDVPLEVVPLTTEYWDRVVASSVEEIRAGRTPNPDIWCNSRVKFGAFYDYLDRIYGTTFDRVASGHYARVERLPRRLKAAELGDKGVEEAVEAEGLSKDVRRQAANAPGVGNVAEAGRPAGECGTAVAEAAGDDEVAMRRQSSTSVSSRGLHWRSNNMGVANREQQHLEEQEEEVRLLLTQDAVKDQTYFLANLSPRQLARVMFPLGYLTKSQVRKLASAADLANKNRKDSQGICFLGKVKFHDFVREHLGEWPGPLLEAETGQPLGLHAGYWFFTVGQRGGIKLPGGPWYVVAKDTLHNAVLVSRQYYDNDKQRNSFKCGPFNWLDAAARPDTRAGPLFVKVRHAPNMYRCDLRVHDVLGDGPYGDDSYGTVTLEENDQGLAAGQYAVFYQGGRCLGCAVIQETGVS